MFEECAIKRTIKHTDKHQNKIYKNYKKYYNYKQNKIILTYFVHILFSLSILSLLCLTLLNRCKKNKQTKKTKYILLIHLNEWISINQQTIKRLKINLLKNIRITPKKKPTNNGAFNDLKMQKPPKLITITIPIDTNTVTDHC